MKISPSVRALVRAHCVFTRVRGQPWIATLALVAACSETPCPDGTTQFGDGCLERETTSERDAGAKTDAGDATLRWCELRADGQCRVCNTAEECSSGVCLEGFCLRCEGAAMCRDRAAEVTGNSAGSGGIGGVGRSSANSAGSSGSSSESGSALGQSCVAADQCESNACTDGLCCERADCGTCSSCGASGRCEPVTGREDKTSCWLDSICDAEGACKLRTSETCESADQCESQQCTDGVCCSMSCGVCSLCIGSSCRSIHGVDDPDGCSGNSSCSLGRCAKLDQISTPLGGAPASTGTEPGFVAQTVTIQTSGMLAEVRARVPCDSTLNLRKVDDSGAPGESVITASAIAFYGPGVMVPFRTSGEDLRTYFLGRPVSSGDRFAFVFSNCDIPTGYDFPGGDLYASPDATTWQKLPTDMGLKVFVTP